MPLAVTCPDCPAASKPRAKARPARLQSVVIRRADVIHLQAALGSPCCLPDHECRRAGA